jgi:hypothetical protein
LPEFCTLCDGGRFPEGRGYVDLFPLHQLSKRTRELAEQLAADLTTQGRRSSFIVGRHVVFGLNTDEVNLIWDAATDHVIGYMPFDDHDWVEETGPSGTLGFYLEDLFSAHRDQMVVGLAASEWWFNLLSKIGET